MLALEGLEAARLDIRADDGSMDVVLNGPAGVVTVGDSEVAPSYLEYLYAQRSVALFLSAAALIWGILWSAIQLLRGAVG